MLNLQDLFMPVQVGNAVLALVKLFFLIGFGLYIIFALIATRQIQVMQKTVITPLSPFIMLMGIAHLLLAVGAFLFVLITL